jgi:hypothetical protein
MALDSQFIDPVLVEDKVLATDSKIFYAITSGGIESYYQFPSNSGSSTSSINYNLSLTDTAFFDRHLMHYATLQFTITLGSVPVGVSCFNYGSTDALQSHSTL